MSFYLEWLIKKVSGVLPFVMVYGFVGPCFSAVDSSAKTEGNFPLPSLRKGSQAICVPGSQGNKPCLGSTGFQAGGDWVGDLRCLELGRAWNQAGNGWFSGWRGSKQCPEGDGTWSGAWVQGCCQGQRHQAAQFESNCHAVWTGKEIVDAEPISCPEA